MNFNPHDYQKHGIKFLVSRPSAGLLLDRGLGKTSMMLAAFSLLKKQGMAKSMLVVAPLRPAQLTWPAEQQKWEQFKHLKVVLLHGPDKDLLLMRGADVYVINPEGLPWLFGQRLPKSWYDVLCVDESTQFKNPTSVRFRLLRANLPLFGRRYILTGSPTPNGLLDLFGQIYILDLGNSLGQYITHFRSAFFDSMGYGGYSYKPRADAEEKIYAKLKPLCLRMAAKDYLEMPPLVGAAWSEGGPLITQVELPPEVMKQYKMMEELMIAQLEEDTITAANAAVASGKCRQIANGGLYLHDEDERTSKMIHNIKTDAVEEIVDELSGVPALVAYEHDHDRQRLQARFKNAPYIGGGVTVKRFKEIEEEWNKGNIQVLLAQPQSVAYGLNLQGTRAAVIWHSQTWRLDLYEQFISRVWRQGQKDRVFVHHIAAKDTIDYVILKALQRKDRTQQALFDALKSAYRRAA
jgi:SNF2 family DNA or RNA helicase